MAKHWKNNIFRPIQCLKKQRVKKKVIKISMNNQRGPTMNYISKFTTSKQFFLGANQGLPLSLL